jgi:hypothetical protein
MAQPRRCPGFALEALAGAGRAQGVGVWHLERHPTVQARIVAQVDTTEGALAQ